MYGLIGNPLGHSFSAKFFNEKFRKEGIEESYNLFPLPDILCVNEMLRENKELKGFNVTIPYKEQIIPLLDSISKEAAEIGAVNVVRVDNYEGKQWLSGFNTDVIGFRESIRPLLRPEMKKALVLGTGGASRSVVYALSNMGIRVTLVSRAKNENTITYSELTKDIIESNLIIVNTTPLGMWPEIDRCPDIPYQFITDRHVCYDLVYNPEETKFLIKSKEKGAVIKNGIEMLHLQALAAWDIWQDKG
jgi:shikimate dehydrogenase